MDTLIETVRVPSADGEAACYLARPREGAHPAVLLIPDVFGLRPQIRAMCARIASWGYVVLAPNLLYRDHSLPLIPMMNLHDPDKMGSALRATHAWMIALPTADTVRDATEWLDWLGDQPYTTGERVGITGYCRGGFIALRLAEALGDRVAATGIFHAGNLASDSPASPHHSVGTVKGELLFRFADHDRSASPKAQATLVSALDAAGVRYSSATYPDAPHGYTMADTPAYQEAAAERHYEELRAMFDRTLA